MFTDGPTKAFGTSRFRELRAAIGVQLTPSSPGGEVLE